MNTDNSEKDILTQQVPTSDTIAEASNHVFGLITDLQKLSAPNIPVLVINNNNEMVDPGKLTDLSNQAMHLNVYTNPNYLEDIPHTRAQIPTNVNNTQDHEQ